MPSTVPIARVCPQCGSSQCSKVKPAAFVSYTLDRICTVCQTRYAPPTPLWASVAFLSIGALLVLVGIPWALINAVAQNPTGTLFGCGILVMGLLACGQGIRSFMQKPVA
jgi:hypothetical protein